MTMMSSSSPSSWSGKRVLVTGGTGFIGSFLVECLLDRGAQVRVPLRAQNFRALSARRSEIDWVEGDLRDPAYCAELVDGMDYVFHLAASRRNTEYHHKRPSDLANDNVRMTLALLDGLREKELRIPVTFFSSANVPPKPDITSIAQGEQIDGYVLGKILCEALWFAAHRQRGFPLLVVRPVGVYGPRDTFAPDGNIIPALMVKARDADAELEVWGDGTQERAFLYVEDVVHAILALVDADASGVQYVTTEQVVSIREVAEAIRKLVRPDLPIRYNPKRQVGARSIPEFPLHETIKSFTWTPLQEGLRKTYESWK